MPRLGILSSRTLSGLLSLAPGAPTIGTATVVSSTTATVTFTAPLSAGSAPITLYTATSSPAGGTGTLSQAGSGTITVTGLTIGIPYTFTVTATNGVGTSPASTTSNSITPVLVIGEAYGGGYFAGQISTNANGIATHNLVIAPKSSQAVKQYKYPSRLNWDSARSTFNGEQNTSELVPLGAAGPAYSQDFTVVPAAHYCNDLVIGGYSDWYLPSLYELEICYYNLKPSNFNNSDVGRSTANPYAVPQRSGNYTYGPYAGPHSASNPAKTLVALFQEGNSEAFDLGDTTVPAYYWTSTGLPNTDDRVGDAYAMIFMYGYARDITKSFEFPTRAMRKVPI